MSSELHWNIPTKHVISTGNVYHSIINVVMVEMNVWRWCSGCVLRKAQSLFSTISGTSFQTNLTKKTYKFRHFRYTLRLKNDYHFFIWPAFITICLKKMSIVPWKCVWHQNMSEKCCISILMGGKRSGNSDKFSG